ncbi:hypothetical protein AA0228_0096 [Gluconobacter frateurii NRIC 0228]|uniref:Uncharacterized protein n=1 Tax=Gluconobacter frateurii NRIC 0228 TaxID=1307946 RepID=A0ABQ0Q7A2_9PROT|nr:hypothetical protein AA0228_0096 [Gluconobacter frateurii NRIC 0228]
MRQIPPENSDIKLKIQHDISGQMQNGIEKCEQAGQPTKAHQIEADNPLKRRQRQTDEKKAERPKTERSLKDIDRVRPQIPILPFPNQPYGRQQAERI